MKPRPFTRATASAGDLEASVSAGLGPSVWRVHTDYYIEGRVISAVAVENVYAKVQFLYLPVSYRALPLELAKVRDADDGLSALSFVRRWGLLGRDDLLPPEAIGRLVGGDPVAFVQGHARTIRTVLQLWERLRVEDKEGVLKILGDVLEPSSPDDQSEVRLWRGTEAVREAFWGRPGLGLAFDVIREFVVGNMAGIAHDLEIADDMNGTPIRPVRLWAVHRWEALIQVIYFHLFNIVSGGRRLAQCLYCGNLFEQTDARQRFCPPVGDPIHARKRGWRLQSVCGARYRKAHSASSSRVRQGEVG